MALTEQHLCKQRIDFDIRTYLRNNPHVDIHSLTVISPLNTTILRIMDGPHCIGEYPLIASLPCPGLSISPTE